MHKLLAPAGEMSENNDISLTKQGGWVVNHKSKAHKEINETVEHILNKHGHHGVVRVYKEASIYNMYMKEQKAGHVDANEARVLRAQDMCPQDQVPAPSKETEDDATLPRSNAIQEALKQVKNKRK